MVDTAVLLLNAAAISGSMLIMISFWTATLWFRFSTCSSIQSQNESPKMEAVTLMTHCFGSLSCSLSHGKYLAASWAFLSKKLEMSLRVKPSYYGTYRWRTSSHLMTMVEQRKWWYKKISFAVLTFLLVADHIPKEVNGDGLILWQICFTINREQVEYLPLGLELGSECLGRDLRILHGWYKIKL